MEDKSSVIFGNKLPVSVIKKGFRTKAKWVKKFMDDPKKEFHLGKKNNEVLYDDLGIVDLVASDEPLELDEKAVIISNIRMGFGHYRIAIALASCAHALGYTPYWFDLLNFDQMGANVIKEQNKLYSLGSRLSQKSKLFNKLVWDPMNCEGFKKLSYNSVDQRTTELLAPLYKDFDKNVPFVGTHVYPSQGAIHAGLKKVVNAIPDNWPMALHLAEGSLHTVQTSFAYQGYKRLDGFSKTELNHMSEKDIVQVGHYIDHEIVSNIEKDVEARIKRLDERKTLAFLMTVGGAGAQYNLYKDIISFLIPYIKRKKVALYINFGDHLEFYKKLSEDLVEMKEYEKQYFDKYQDLKVLASKFDEVKQSGITVIYNKNIFEAVYSTNILMRVCDLLITKPSELAFYPVPKLMIQRVGGHEAYGAIHSAEVGDGTKECKDIKIISSMLASFVEDGGLLRTMNKNILKNKAQGLYDGGYEVIKLAVK